MAASKRVFYVLHFFAAPCTCRKGATCPSCLAKAPIFKEGSGG